MSPFVFNFWCWALRVPSTPLLIIFFASLGNMCGNPWEHSLFSWHLSDSQPKWKLGVGKCTSTFFLIALVHCCDWVWVMQLPVPTVMCCCFFLEIQILRPCWKRAGDICILCRHERQRRWERRFIFFLFLFFLVMVADFCWPVSLRKMSVPCGFSEYDSRRLCAPTFASSCAVLPTVLYFYSYPITRWAWSLSCV